MNTVKYSLLILSIFLILSCSRSVRYRTSSIEREKPKEALKGYSTTGLASYYGKKYHGRKTASGEIFNMNKMTAAHRSLPFFTKLKVTNLKNNQSVIVKVNDRGPFIEGRIIDLSYAAAKRIGMLRDGVVKVKIEAVQ